MEIVSQGEGRAVLRFPVQPQFHNAGGIMQGGMYAVLLDMAMAVASPGMMTATLQYSILRPVSSGYVTVSAELVKAGRRIVYMEAEMRDEEGRLVARGNQNGPPTSRET